MTSRFISYLKILFENCPDHGIPVNMLRNTGFLIDDIPFLPLRLYTSLSQFARIGRNLEGKRHDGEG